MPQIPNINFNQSAVTPSPLAERPSEATLLMAAADVAKSGGFNDPGPKLTPSRGKPKKVIR
jgi:hypothetical protein